MSRVWTSRWNPFACDSTSLAPNHLLAAKLLVLYVFAVGGVRVRPRPRVPFHPAFDAIGDSPLWDAFPLLFAGLALALFFNRMVRAASLGLGLIILLSVLSSRLYFSNNNVLFAVTLMLIGLQERGPDGEGPGPNGWMLRAQLALIYLGAGLNKLLDVDWRSGRFFEYWTGEILGLGWYGRAAEALPPLALSQSMGWLTIGVELGLAAAFAVPRWTGPAVAVGLAFHAGMLAFTGGEISWVFLYGMTALYLTVVRWPSPAPREAGPAASPRPLSRRRTPARFEPLLYFSLATGFFVVRGLFR